MSRIIFAALSVFALSFLLFSAEAEKSPLWEWESTNSVNHVAISEDSRNISAAYASSISLWYNDTTNPRNTKTVGSGISSMAMSTDGKYVLIGGLKPADGIFNILHINGMAQKKICGVKLM